MGQSSTKPDVDVSATRHAALMRPKVEDYVRKVKKFATLCTTCRGGEWAAHERDSVLSFHESLHRPTRKARKDLISALRSMPMDHNQIIQMELLVAQDRKATATAAHAAAVAAMDDLSKTMTAAYARDIFKILAQELRFKNPWEGLARSTLVLGEASREDREADGIVRETLKAIKESQERFEHYVELVVESEDFLEPMSSGATPQPIKNAADWAEAIRTLPRVFAMLDSHVAPLMQALRTRVDKLLSVSKKTALPNT